ECKFTKKEAQWVSSDACEAGYYLINENGTILTEEGIEGILLECKGENNNYNCEEITIPGFYKDKNEKYIECYSNYYRCNIVNLENNNTCGKSNLGKLVKISDEGKYGLCIAFKRIIFLTGDDNGNFSEVDSDNYYQKEQYFTLSFGSENPTNRYLIKRNKNTVFSFDKTVDFYVLKVDENSISFDKEYSTGKI
ncbi:hypothetical protein PIROE2DRAFT_15001, partial [Piromyces sp. E2]